MYEGKETSGTRDACKVLEKLGSDEKFRVAFARNPVEAIKKEGFKLTANDERLLGSIDLCKFSLLMKEGMAEGSCNGYCNAG